MGRFDRGGDVAFDSQSKSAAGYMTPGEMQERARNASNRYILEAEVVSTDVDISTLRVRVHMYKNSGLSHIDGPYTACSCILRVQTKSSTSTLGYGVCLLYTSPSPRDS